jgi:hypothetical protein
VFRLDEGLRVYLHREPIDFRLNINGLALLVEKALGAPSLDATYVRSVVTVQRSRLLDTGVCAELHQAVARLLVCETAAMQPLVFSCRSWSCLRCALLAGQLPSIRHMTQWSILSSFEVVTTQTSSQTSSQSKKPPGWVAFAWQLNC